MNGIVWESGSISVLSDSTEACESFLESYSRGIVDVGGFEPPDIAKLELSEEVLASGHLEPPLPPDESQRVRELYTLSLALLNAQVSIPSFERAQSRHQAWL